MAVSYDPSTGTFSGAASAAPVPAKGAAPAANASTYYDPATGKFSSTPPAKPASVVPTTTDVPRGTQPPIPVVPSNSTPAAVSPAAAGSLLQGSGGVQGSTPVPQIPQTDAPKAQTAQPLPLPQYSKATITPTNKPVSNTAPILGAQQSQPTTNPEAVPVTKGSLNVTGVDNTKPLADTPQTPTLLDRLIGQIPKVPGYAAELPVSWATGLWNTFAHPSKVESAAEQMMGLNGTGNKAADVVTTPIRFLGKVLFRTIGMGVEPIATLAGEAAGQEKLANRVIMGQAPVSALDQMNLKPVSGQEFAERILPASVAFALTVAPFLDAPSKGAALKLADLADKNGVKLTFSDLQDITRGREDLVDPKKVEAFKNAVKSPEGQGYVQQMKKGYIELPDDYSKPTTVGNILRNAATKPLTDIGSIAADSKFTKPDIITKQLGDGSQGFQPPEQTTPESPQSLAQTENGPVGFQPPATPDTAVATSPLEQLLSGKEIPASTPVGFKPPTGTALEELQKPTQVQELSKTATNSLENSTRGIKPGAIERAKAEIQAGNMPSVKVRTIEDGSTFIEDGRHHLEAAKQLGLQNYPVEDVTSKYTQPETSTSPALKAVADVGKTFYTMMHMEEAALKAATYVDDKGVTRRNPVKQVQIEKQMIKENNAAHTTAQNKFYDTLEPKYKIGDTVTVQRYKKAGSGILHKVNPDGTSTQGPTPESIGEKQQVKITKAEFDTMQSLDQMQKTGFPSSFKLSNLIGTDVKTGEHVTIYKSDLVNGEHLIDTLKHKPEDVLKEFIDRQKNGKIVSKEQQARADFQKKWADAYGDRPATIEQKTALQKAKPSDIITKSEKAAIQKEASQFTNREEESNYKDFVQRYSKFSTNVPQDYAQFVKQVPEAKNMFYSQDHTEVEQFDRFADRYNGSRSSVALHSELIPGLSKFITEDVAPIGRGLKDAALEARTAVAPTYNLGKEAQLAKNLVRGTKATIANTAQLNNVVNQTSEKYFSNFTEDQNIKNKSDYERTGTFPNAPKGYSEMYKKTMQEVHDGLSEIKTDPLGFVENYIIHKFTFKTPADLAKGTSFLANQLTGNRTLSGTKSVFRERKYDMPTDEALAAMRAKGIHVQDAFPNPETARQAVVKNYVKLREFKKLKEQLKKEGLITFVKNGATPPADFTGGKLDDPAFKVFFPGETFVQNGTYYAQSPQIARLLNNAVSIGLQNSKIYQGIRAFSNSINALQLGLSAFHGVVSSNSASIVDIQMGVNKLFRGELSGLGNIGRGLIPTASAIQDIIKGNSFMNGLKNSDPEAYKILTDVINPAGARLNIDREYQVKGLEQLRNKIKSGNVPGALLHAIPALIETIQTPLFTKAIPAIKLGIMLDSAADINNRFPDATKDQLRELYGKAWDHIENVFGQMTYDNLFWHRAFKDSLQVAVRAVGWDIGAPRLVLGAFKDLTSKSAYAAQMLGSKVTGGKIPEPAPRTPEQQYNPATFYVIATALFAGIMGGIYQYLHTGHGPKTIQDFYQPKDGTKDKYGNENRVNLPIYPVKDVYDYATNPLQTATNKISPGPLFIWNLLNNRDYFNDMIRNPDDPVAKQFEQTALFIIKNTLPFSLQNLIKVNSSGGGAERQAESFAGIGKVPVKNILTPDQLKLQKEERQLYGAYAPRTPEQVQIDNLKAQAKTEIQNGDLTTYNKLKKMGAFKTPKEAAYFLIDAKENPVKQQKAIQRSVEQKLKYQGKQ